ncbi:MAG: signal recognition particle-docking protein FtsY [Actinobacteria bacterium]|nr:signal recognition particle-docking protein FtsY [Actinomycetota bacterium]
MEEDRKLEKERRKREKEEAKQKAREEKARLKEEKRELKEARKQEKQQALEELQELPEVEEGQGEELYCGPEVEECVEVGEGDAGAVAAAAETETLPPEESLPEAMEIPPREESAADIAMEAEAIVEAGPGGPAPEKEGFEDYAAAGEADLEIEEERLEEELPLEEEKERWLSRLRGGLSKSRMNFVAPLFKAMATRRFDEVFWEEVEDILVGADVGIEMTTILVERVKERMAREKVRDPEGLLALFREVLADALDVGDMDLRYAPGGPSVLMVVGVNGTGKTTTIAKLAHLLRRDGKRVLLAAGDTFRAAGVEQLETWGERVGVHTVKHKQGADAAAVVHDAVEAALARSIDVVIADTAGRLHTKTNLMEELKKIKRVAERNAPVTETLLVIDATTGQNGLIQAQQFGDAVEVTGVVLTKLDGTAKGGIVVAIVHELGIPIKFIGVGEKLDDLHAFDPQEFASALFS